MVILIQWKDRSKAIAEKLNKDGKKSPSYCQKLYNNKNQGYNKPAITFRYLWDPTAVKRVLTNEFYTGTLVCHIVIVMNAPFGEYGEIFDDDGNVTLAHNGDYKPISLEEVKN